jgi:hypothetical protein
MKSDRVPTTQTVAAAMDIATGHFSFADEK